MSSRLPRLSWLAVGLVAPLFAACGGSEQAGPPPGTWSGSTAAGTGIEITVSGGEVEVNGKEARRRPRGVIEATEMPGRPQLDCRVRARGEELRCTLTTGDRTETIDLLRL